MLIEDDREMDYDAINAQASEIVADILSRNLPTFDEARQAVFTGDYSSIPDLLPHSLDFSVKKLDRIYSGGR